MFQNSENDLTSTLNKLNTIEAAEQGGEDAELAWWNFRNPSGLGFWVC